MNRPGRVAGIDLGGTNTSVALVDGSLTVLRRSDFATPSDPGEAYRRIRKEFKWLNIPEGVPAAVSLCGLLAPGGRQLISAPNLGWADIDLTEMFGWIKGGFIAVNDGTAAAWARYRSKNHASPSGLLSVTLGTGVGGGLVIDGNLILGAAELGHIKLDPEGPLCGCGRKGCLEAYIGGSFIPDRAREWFSLEIESASHLYALAKSGNAKALECWKKIGFLAGYAFAGVVNLIGVEEVSIGGQIAASAGRFFMDTLGSTLRENLLSPSRQKVEINVSEYGQDMSLIGAASVILAPPGNITPPEGR